MYSGGKKKYEKLQAGKPVLFWYIRKIHRNEKNRVRGQMGKYDTFRKTPDSSCKWKTCFTSLPQPSKAIDKQAY